MADEDRRRSIRHQLLDTPVEVHVGPQSGTGLVLDISKHGMGLVLPSQMKAKKGDLLWLLVDRIAPYAITATICRMGENGEIGVEFEEILKGDALEKVEALPQPELLSSEPADPEDAKAYAEEAEDVA